MGGSRNEGDARRVEELRGLAKQLGIEVYLSFPLPAFLGPDQGTSLT